MLKLKRILGKEDELLGQIMVMIMELIMELISFSGYLIVRNAANNLERPSLSLYCAITVNLIGNAFKNSYQQGMNKVEIFRRRTLKWITEDMAALEDMLVKEILPGLSHITPPPSHQGRSQSRKRSGSRRSSRSTLTRRKSNLSNLLELINGDVSNSAAHSTNEIQQAATPRG
jgi:hypothetical protein